MITMPEKYLKELFHLAIECCHPKNILSPHLPEDKSQPVTLICAGKAAASMAHTFETVWEGPIKGIAVVPFGHREECCKINVIEASHPEPDNHSLNAAERALKLANKLKAEDTVYILLSGGGSSLLCSPCDGITLEQKKKITKNLLKSGAPIDEINTVRKHLSSIKGGRLLKACAPSTVKTLVISDVVGNDPSVIASGPTVGDPTSSYDALKILEKYSIETPASVELWLNNSKSETIKPNDPIIKKSSYKIISSAKGMLNHIELKVNEDGYECINLGELQGDAKELGIKHAKMILTQKPSKPTIFICGGETTVCVKGSGKGGRNSEYLLSLAITLNGAKKIYGLAGDTDGIDGLMDNAGAIITSDTLKRLTDLKHDPKTLLKNNDSYTAFNKLNDLIMTGPTRTNVNDFRAILILPN